LLVFLFVSVRLFYKLFILVKIICKSQGKSGF